MKKSLLIIVLFILVACSQQPVTTVEGQTPMPWVAGTETALAAANATFTPWVEGIQTARAVSSQPPAVTNDALPTIPFPSFTPAASEKPTDFSPVLYGGKSYGGSSFFLLGGVSRDGWLSPDESVARFAGEVTYSLHNLRQESKYFLWGKAPEFSPVCRSYSVGTDASLDEAGFVAVIDGWNITKRDVSELSTDMRLYQQAVLDWLTAQGVAAPQPGNLQILRVDLEGDGVDEVFISATRLDESQHTTKAGDYSIVLMRKVNGNDAVTIPIVADIYRTQELETTFPKTYSIGNFIDLNQDGILEVVVDIQRWEGLGATVYQVEGQTFTQALQAGCGLQ